MSMQRETMSRILRTPRGVPFTLQRWSERVGPSVASKALASLVEEGAVVRLHPGVYVRPRTHPLLGQLTPSPEATVKAAAEKSGQRVEIGGADALRHFGLSTQVPMQKTFLTSGRTRTVPAGRRAIHLKHVDRVYLQHAGTPAGAALSALRELGPSGITLEATEKVLRRLSAVDRRRLKRQTKLLPGWLARPITRAYDRLRAEATEKVRVQAQKRP